MSGLRTGRGKMAEENYCTTGLSTMESATNTRMSPVAGVPSKPNERLNVLNQELVILHEVSTFGAWHMYCYTPSMSIPCSRTFAVTFGLKGVLAPILLQTVPQNTIVHVAVFTTRELHVVEGSLPDITRFSIVVSKLSAFGP